MPTLLLLGAKRSPGTGRPWLQARCQSSGEASSPQGQGPGKLQAWCNSALAPYMDTATLSWKLTETNCYLWTRRNLMGDTWAQNNSEPHSKLPFTYLPNHHHQLALVYARSSVLFLESIVLVHEHTPTSSLSSPRECTSGRFCSCLWLKIHFVFLVGGYMATFHGHCPGLPVERIGIKLT